MKKVVILQRVLPHYRVPVFDRLADVLKRENIRLEVLYGQQRPGTVPETVRMDRPWAVFAKNSYFRMRHRELVYQHVPAGKLDVDLVIFEQANRLIHNYPLLFFKKKRRKIAYWGHGKNMQNRGGLLEQWKNKLINQVDWWFAYTDISRDIVAETGFPAVRITVVCNAIDTDALNRELINISLERAVKTLGQDGIAGTNIGLYCGGLYTDKKIDFLLHAAKKIRQQLADFELVVIGSGPEEDKVRKAANECSWIHYPGAKFGRELAPYLRSARALLMPGLVGLVILDSFVASVPLITTENNIHSPEIAYLKNNENGIITPYSADGYAKAVINLLSSDDLQKKLQAGCRASARKYTLANMVKNFADGISTCLAADT